MDVKSAITKRRSIRAYKDKKVNQGIINDILDAARYTPSSGNVQNWHVVIITDEEIKQKISDCCLQQNWMNQAPVLIAVCNRIAEVERMYGERGKNLYSIQNCAAFIQNILTMATAHGLATCWVGAFDDNAMSRCLNLPSGIKPEAIITIGYADEKPNAPIRFTCQDIAFYETWGSRRQYPQQSFGLCKEPPAKTPFLKRILKKFKK